MFGTTLRVRRRWGYYRRAAVGRRKRKDQVDSEWTERESGDDQSSITKAKEDPNEKSGGHGGRRRTERRTTLHIKTGVHSPNRRTLSLSFHVREGGRDSGLDGVPCFAVHSRRSCPVPRLGRKSGRKRPDRLSGVSFLVGHLIWSRPGML